MFRRASHPLPVDGSAEAARELILVLQGSGSERLPDIDNADVIVDLCAGVESGDGAAEALKSQLLLCYARTVAASSSATADAHATVARLTLPEWSRAAILAAPAAARAEACTALRAAAALGGCFGCAAHAASANAAELLVLTEGEGAAAARELAVALLYEAADLAMGAGKFGLYGTLQERATAIDGAVVGASISGLREWK